MRAETKLMRIIIPTMLVAWASVASAQQAVDPMAPPPDPMAQPSDPMAQPQPTTYVAAPPPEMRRTTSNP